MRVRTSKGGIPIPMRNLKMMRFRPSELPTSASVAHQQMAKGKGKEKMPRSAIVKTSPRSAKAKGKEKVPPEPKKKLHFSALPIPVRANNVENAVCRRCSDTRPATAVAVFVAFVGDQGGGEDREGHRRV